MEEKLKAYVYACFEDAPKNARSIEVREEICSNVLDRYRDLLRSGATPDEAYDIARRSVGNVQEILEGLEEVPKVQLAASSNAKKRGAFIGIGVAMYILGVAMLIAIEAMGGEAQGVVALFVCVAVATGLCVYGNAVYPKVPPVTLRGMSEEEAEEFQQWRAERYETNVRKKKYSGVLWPLICAAYFIVSFATGAWYITWIIFIIGGAIDRLIEITAK